MNPWQATDEYEGKTYAEAGVDPDEAKKYWQENPEKYKAYLASKNKIRTGVDETSKTQFVADPVNESSIPPKPPKRKAQGYGYRSRGLGSLSSGQAKTLKGAMHHALEYGQKGQVDIDIIYDQKAYGEGAMGRLVRAGFAVGKEKIGNWKTNPNYKEDYQNWQKQKEQTLKDWVKWRKTKDMDNIPDSLKAYQERINNSWEPLKRWNNNTDATYIMSYGQPVKS